MDIAIDELIGVLSQLNPWWRAESIPDLPEWKRASFNELHHWVYDPPAPRAILLSGARQVGKTTLLLQTIDTLIKKQNIEPSNILYATFDHPLIKMVGIDFVLKAWRERVAKHPGKEYLFLDEAQFIPNFGTWVKHQVDFLKERRIVFTGSAMPLIEKNQESGLGRWHAIKLTTLSFYEYLKLIETDAKLYKKNFGSMLESNFIKNRFPIQSKYFELPKLPTIGPLKNLFDLSQQEYYEISELAEPYIWYFHEYLVRGGFPQTALVRSIHQAHRLLREDIIDKALKRDMTAVFGVRRVIELEQIFLYLCMHDGGLLDLQQLCNNLGVKRPTAQHFIDLLEATHLIYRLQPFGYGKEILRAKFKIYLADPAISSAVLLKGEGILDNPTELGIATETAVFKHLYANYYSNTIRFTYWRGNKDHEVDLIAETNNQKIPFEIKYRARIAGNRELKGLIEFCNKESSKFGYVVTKSVRDFGILKENSLKNTKIMQIPAALLCYWMGESELEQTSSID